MRRGVVAGTVAGVVSGAPSTVHALVTGGDPFAATAAAGSLVLRTERRPRLIAAAVGVHFAVSIGWGVVLAAVLPRRHTTAWGAVAGLAIAALDLGLVGRRFPMIRALPVAPQVADHVLYGAVVGAVLASGRGSPGPPWRT
ncbi:MAG TPA: hypothetical protein VGX25_30725 [Actinophytocola sp.]|uniref:hypothetical protein n=1 Tax=Actinophytocola sp. TaxID=1872138 RepID=UPI002DDD177C|nr:hypothetical protein [Actinophytocola sp.]HEV2783783.1 hypothetical protein [Actinophytocola sp.]